MQVASLNVVSIMTNKRSPAAKQLALLRGAHRGFVQLEPPLPDKPAPPSAETPEPSPFPSRAMPSSTSSSSATASSPAPPSAASSFALLESSRAPTSATIMPAPQRAASPPALLESSSASTSATSVPAQPRSASPPALLEPTRASTSSTVVPAPLRAATPANSLAPPCAVSSSSAPASAAVGDGAALVDTMKVFAVIGSVGEICLLARSLGFGLPAGLQQASTTPTCGTTSPTPCFPPVSSTYGVAACAATENGDQPFFCILCGERISCHIMDTDIEGFCDTCGVAALRSDVFSSTLAGFVSVGPVRNVSAQSFAARAALRHRLRHLWSSRIEVSPRLWCVRVCACTLACLRA
mmetsp:Transcript_28525/g.81920  ORF Transcript_28525/g.81920 Transcript_28525/m.81920 type:complete len:353 (-) Transcript_28525:38-1096(-)